MPREKKEKRSKKKALSRKIHTAFNKHKRKTLIQSWKYRSLQLVFKSQAFHWVATNTGRVVQKWQEPGSNESPFLCLVLCEGKKGKVRINYSPFVSQTCTCKWRIPLLVLLGGSHSTCTKHCSGLLRFFDILGRSCHLNTIGNQVLCLSSCQLIFLLKIL